MQGGWEVDWPAVFRVVFFGVFFAGLIAAAFKVRRDNAVQALKDAERTRLANQAYYDEGVRRQQAERDAEAARWADLNARFGADIAARCWRKEFWQGQTEVQLRASLGRPEDIDEKVLRTKKKHTYKYRGQGHNRYGLRVFLDDYIVVGWEDQS